MLHRQGRLSRARVARLDRIGFQWEPTQVRWQRQYDRLVKYRRAHGHCHVRSLSALGQWLEKQRRFRRQGKLSADRIRQLTALGFDWEKHHRFGEDFEQRWQRNFRALVAFRKKHRHCRVPQDRNRRTGLGIWVSNVRAQYARGELRPDRVRALNKLGFCWRMPASSKGARGASLQSFKAASL